MIDDENKTEQLVGEVVKAMTGTSTGRTHANLALHHLFAACRFAARVIHVEQSNAGEPFGDFWEEILQNALGVVTLTVASLEAFANEMYFEGTIFGTTLSAEATAELADLVDGPNILNKYRLALVIRGNKRLDRGATPAQNADALIKLRNAVVHFHPEWFEEKGEHEKLSTKWLADKFEPSVFLPNERIFPRAWASGSFAQWALRTTVNFIDHFYAEAGLPSPIKPFRARLSKLSENALQNDHE